MSSGIFDIDSPEIFFYSIQYTFEKYKNNKEKSIESLLYIIMGLNHLRDWIAPGYDFRSSPQKANEFFYKLIFDECASFQIINKLCNRTKHLTTSVNTSSLHDLPLDEWMDIDSVKNFDRGPATDYFIDGKNIIEVMEDVIKSYKSNWFDKKTPLVKFG